VNVYEGREQTQAKHYVLKRYLQALAFKVLREWGITYVDGFSGPWESQSEDFSDTSFMIAINVLKDAQKRIEEQTGVRRTIRCFFAESDRATYDQLVKAVEFFHKPDEGFNVETYFGKFEDAVTPIRTAIGTAFPLIFIDPTGWTGYPFPKIRAIFGFPRCEVLINFMYAFISRFVTSQDAKTIASLDPILGGPGWQSRLDANLPPGLAVEKLFRETLKQEGNFAYVVSTKIDKSTADRPHFFLAYGTKNREGLKAFRQTEYDALREHAKARGAAKDRKRENRTGLQDLLGGGLLDELHESTIDDIVREQKSLAKEYIKGLVLATPTMKFSAIVDRALQAFMLRETNIKDICSELAAEGFIANTWGSGNKKPKDETVIHRA
jgi:three-Cys-motif partner protein